MRLYYRLVFSRSATMKAFVYSHCSSKPTPVADFKPRFWMTPPHPEFNSIIRYMVMRNI